MSASGQHSRAAQAADASRPQAAALPGLVGRWADALAAYHTAIERFWKEIRDPARGAAPLRSSAAEAHLELSEKGVAEVREYAGAREAPAAGESFARLLDVSDAGEEARRRLEAADNIVSEPGMINLATSRLSRTYSEEVGLMQRSMKQTRAAAIAAETNYSLFVAGLVSRGPLAASMTVAGARKAYLEPGRVRGGIATEMYLAYLAFVAGAAGSEALQARTMLEQAKDMVLGESAASSATVKETAFHPIQAMGIVVGPAEPLRAQD